MKEIGRYHQINMLEAVESYSLALFSRVLGFEPEQIRDIIEGVKHEMVDRSIHLYTKFIYVYGQKDE